MTEEFLEFSKVMGNDLSTPMPEYDFPGLNEGDCWCLCAGRWQEAFEAGMAPKVKLEACEESALDSVQLNDLQDHAIWFFTTKQNLVHWFLWGVTKVDK